MSRAVFHGSSSGPPVPSKEIARRAVDYEYSPQISLSQWLRTASTILREADTYFKEGNEEQAFLLYMRHMDLIVTHLPSHPQARDPRYEKMLVDMNTKFPAIAGRMEKLKLNINARHEAYQRERQQQLQKEQEEQALLRQQRRSRGSSISSNGSTSYGQYGHAVDGRGSYFSDTQSSRGRPGELEKMGRRLSMQTSHSSNTSPSLHPAFSSKEHFEEHGWSYEPAIPTPTESVGSRRISWKKPDDEFDLQRRLQELQLRTQTPVPLALLPGQSKREEKEKDKDKDKDKGGLGTLKALEAKVTPRPVSMPYPLLETKARTEYPMVPKRAPYPGIQTQLPNIDDFANPSKLEQYRHSIDRQPTLPPKIRDEFDPNYIAPRPSMGPPPRPSKDRAPSAPSLAGTYPEPLEKSKRKHTFECVAYTERGEPLRTIFIPKDLRSEFLAIADRNTRRNLETCGILAGFLRDNALFVTRLVIPQQESTSDTCNMTDEPALFDYIDKEDLMVLGWIHTHPTQTCFMSSVDLHTHYGFQMMLPECIAIVCAPNHEPSYGVFRLTDPGGLKTIRTCTNKGLFHPHSSPDVYTDAIRPGHVCEVDKLRFKIHDLRTQ
ncbi:hypothetical protein TWF569_003889 [Orbilia oligospora]|uniref:MPN domain-containing protein n=1 Tax=Orbilia oligospora TaxID=2813651 RepID=A0A7C8N5H5_ORBOL|nr:hypothetical protein TWF706_002471 [Orbilia oligospora]KAF3099999.1 hypothetical protein TWF102_005407 [Orbilia oligospora]KAF3114197.1 hypothetical protein TWF103_001607 [Orbilia oligospora]KAF3118574.1 hypothetical protein TWF703_004821 [Orbilia oligospora]KAF3125214.1 hypothetical protein TWF594_001634 [Orbilia oligospora]